MPDSVERTFDEILADESIDLVVTAALPRERAAISLAAIRAGKHVVSDKPGVTTHAQLETLRAEVAERPGRPWTVLFGERFENRAIAEAVRLARAGAIGRVVHVNGTRRIDLSDVQVGWADDLLADIADGGQRMMSQAHVVAVSQLTLKAQAGAAPWGAESDG